MEQLREQSHLLKIRPEGYPQPVFVPEGATWDTIDRNSYQPQDYTAQTVFDHDISKDPSNPRLWADPVDPRTVDHPFSSHIGEVKVDHRGRPLNPMGPTGIEGRGLLGKWGVNNAVDPIVTRIDKDRRLQIVVVTRKDSGDKAIPGGMLDKNETIQHALERELGEETSAKISFESADLVYQGYTYGPRDTDNAWIETDAYHVHLEDGDEVELLGGDDATDAKWITVDAILLDNMYSNHGSIVKKAIEQWQEKNHKKVDQSGLVLDSK